MSYTFFLLTLAAASASTLSILAAWQAVASARKAQSACSSIRAAWTELIDLQRRVLELDGQYQAVLQSWRRVNARVEMRAMRAAKAARHETKAELRARLGVNDPRRVQALHAGTGNQVDLDPPGN